MATVYQFPPVTVSAVAWPNWSMPSARSESALTGKEYISAAKRRRRQPILSVDGRGGVWRSGGYMQSFRRLLDGVHYARLSGPVAAYTGTGEDRTYQALTWTEGGSALSWTEGGSAVAWRTGLVLTGTPTTSGGFPAIMVTGLTPNAPAAEPGEYLTIYGDSGAQTHMVLAPATANGSGSATIRLLNTATEGGPVGIGEADGGVFALEIEIPPRSRAGAWEITVSAREVFSDEVGGFTEANPWA